MPSHSCTSDNIGILSGLKRKRTGLVLSWQSSFQKKVNFGFNFEAKVQEPDERAERHIIQDFWSFHNLSSSGVLCHLLVFLVVGLLCFIVSKANTKSVKFWVMFPSSNKLYGDIDFHFLCHNYYHVVCCSCYYCALLANQLIGIPKKQSFVKIKHIKAKKYRRAEATIKATWAGLQQSYRPWCTDAVAYGTEGPIRSLGYKWKDF